jgi:hypothetical protein
MSRLVVCDREITYQLAIQAASVTVELVVETTAPKGCVRSAAVRTFGLDPARSGIAIPAKNRRIDAGGSGTRARRPCGGSILGLDRKVGATAGGVCPCSPAGAKFGRGNSLGRGFLDRLRRRKRCRVRFVVVMGNRLRFRDGQSRNGGLLHENIEIGRDTVIE